MDIDEESATEVLESFKELSNEVEIYLDRIACDDAEIDNLNGLFRAIHSIKGNAAMVQLKTIVNYTHSLEEVIDAIRGDIIQPNTQIVEALQLGFDRLRDLHERELMGYQFDNLNEVELGTLYSNLANADESTSSNICREICSILAAGFVNEAYEEAIETEEIECLTIPDTHTKGSFDLEFFKELAIQVDKQSIYWDGRSETLCDWALKMNGLGGSKINSDQLAAAVYLHDIGMSFVTVNTLEKSENLSENEIEEIRQHPHWGYNYLIRIKGWDEAATMVLEHHERIDGKGYPYGNKGKLIHDGAKILAIIDAYFSITNGRADRANRRSIVRAISEINARKGSQFDEIWVEIFNQMIKEELRGNRNGA